MTSVGFLLKVRQEMIDDYTRRHREVWPEMLDALRRTGWHNHSLFLRPDGMLFGYFETPLSLEEAVEAMATEEVNERWQRDMAPFFEGTGGLADEMLEQLTEVFHLD